MKRDRTQPTLTVWGLLLGAGLLAQVSLCQQPVQSSPGRGAAGVKAGKVAVVTDAAEDPPSRNGRMKLEQALREKGCTVTEGTRGIAGADFELLAGVMPAHGPAAVAIDAMKAPVPSGAEALTVRTGARYRGKPAIVLAGADASGLMYAELDLADRVGWTAKGGDPFQFARNASEKPYLRDRGVTIFYDESRVLREPPA